MCSFEYLFREGGSKQARNADNFLGVKSFCFGNCSLWVSHVTETVIREAEGEIQVCGTSMHAFLHLSHYVGVVDRVIDWVRGNLTSFALTSMHLLTHGARPDVRTSHILGEAVQPPSVVVGQLSLGLVNIPNLQTLRIHSMLTFGKFGVPSKHSMSPPPPYPNVTLEPLPASIIGRRKE